VVRTVETITATITARIAIQNNPLSVIHL